MALTISPEVEASMRAGIERNNANAHRDTSAYGHGQRLSDEEKRARDERLSLEKAREARPAETPKARDVPAERAAPVERPRRELSGRELDEARARAAETARMREEGRTKVGGEWLTREQVKEREAQARPAPTDRSDSLRERFIAQGEKVPMSRADYAEQERQRIVAEGRNEKQGIGRIKEDAHRQQTAERNAVYTEGRADYSAIQRGEKLPKAREEIGRQSTPAAERGSPSEREITARERAPNALERDEKGSGRLSNDSMASWKADVRAWGTVRRQNESRAHERSDGVPLTRADLQAIERDRGGPRTPPRQIERAQQDRERPSIGERIQNVRENVQERVQQFRERATRSFGRE